jgi:hypothetical protein
MIFTQLIWISLKTMFINLFILDLLIYHQTYHFQCLINDLKHELIIETYDYFVLTTKSPKGYNNNYNKDEDEDHNDNNNNNLMFYYQKEKFFYKESNFIINLIDNK